MDIYNLARNLLVYVVYPICIIIIANEVYRRIFWKYMMEEEEEDDDDDREFHEPSIEMCSRCKNPHCLHRIAEYMED